MTVVTADTDVKKHKEAARAKRADRAVGVPYTDAQIAGANKAIEGASELDD